MIKLLACAFMLIDHIGAIFFPQIEWLRLIGRLSMPMYAYCIAKGIERTHDIKRYLLRVLVIAVLAQPIYQYVLNKELNICFDWAVAILLAWCIRSKTPIIGKMALCIAMVLVVAYLPISYGLYGVAYVFMFLYMQKHKTPMPMQYILWLILHCVYIAMHRGGAIQIFTLPTIALIDMLQNYDASYIKLQKSVVMRYFYPIHLCILAFLLFLQNWN